MVMSTADRVSWRLWAVMGLLPVVVAVAVGMRGVREEREDSQSASPTLAELKAVGHSANPEEETRRAKPAHRFPVEIRRPAGPPVIELTEPDPLGRMGRVACTTCHSVRPPNMSNQRPSDLDEFHTGMPFEHGRLVCYSCHNPGNADTLRLADGRAVEYRQVMTLCGQCHGPQFRDYRRYSHGGVNGYWDLTRGGRVRANCIDCHDPHVPRFPKMIPTFKPKDRFLVTTHDDHTLQPRPGGGSGHE